MMKKIVKQKRVERDCEKFFEKFSNEIKKIIFDIVHSKMFLKKLWSIKLNMKNSWHEKKQKKTSQKRDANSSRT